MDPEDNLIPDLEPEVLESILPEQTQVCILYTIHILRHLIVKNIEIIFDMVINNSYFM